MSTSTIWIESDEIPEVINIYNNASDMVRARFTRECKVLIIEPTVKSPNNEFLGFCGRCKIALYEGMSYCPDCGARVVE